MKKFSLLPHSVTSDVAFEAFGKTPEELFTNAAEALFSVMCDITKVESKEKRHMALRAENLEDLLYDFLSELIFLKDRDNILFGRYHLAIHYDTRKYHSNNNSVELAANAFGEKIDPKRHSLGVDVKAVTKHNFSVVKKRNIYKATVVLDI